MSKERKIDKYLKIKALADSGTGGEQQNAKALLAKMEAETPGIAKAAEVYLRLKNAASGQPTDSPSPRPPPPPPPGVWSKEEPHPRTSTEAPRGNWENIFQWTNFAYESVRNVAETIFEHGSGRELSQHVTSSTKVSRTGNVLLTLRLPLWVQDEAKHLNPVQQLAFRDALHELLDDELNNFF